MADYHMAPDHMVRDLNMTLEYKGKETFAVRVPVLPSICNDRGAVHAGVLATLVDVASGALVAITVYPDLTATGDLRMYSTQPAETGEVSVVGSVLRAGRATVVAKAEIMAGIKGSSVSIGSGIATFYRLSRNDSNVEMVKDVISNQTATSRAEGLGLSEHLFDKMVKDFITNQTTTFRTEGLGLSEHLFDKAGLRVIDEIAGVVELDMSAYVRNHIGSLKGGMVANLADVAGQYAARAVTHKHMITTDLAMSYLSQGRVGPFYTKTEVLRINSDSVLTRVGIFDRGAGDLLMSVAMNTAMSA